MNITQTVNTSWYVSFINQFRYNLTGFDQLFYISSKDWGIVFQFCVFFCSFFVILFQARDFKDIKHTWVNRNKKTNTYNKTAHGVDKITGTPCNMKATKHKKLEPQKRRNNKYFTWSSLTDPNQLYFCSITSVGC